jgi:hypothetical protein
LKGDSDANPALVFFTLAITMVFVGFIAIALLDSLVVNRSYVGIAYILNTLILCPLALTFCFVAFISFLAQNLTRK